MNRSRLYRHNAKEGRKQTLIYGILSILFVVFMIKYGLPGMIRMLSTGKTNVGSDEGFEIPLQTPELDPLPEATFSGKIKVSGFAGSGLKVKLLVDDTETDTVSADNEGNFSFDLVALREGENNIGVKSVNEKGKESNISKMTIIYDKKQPEVEIREPMSEASFTGKDQQLLSISGKISEDNCEVTVNGNYVAVDSDNFFTYKTKLNEGMNEFVVKVTDEAGNSSEKLVRANFTP